MSDVIQFPDRTLSCVRCKETIDRETWFGCQGVNDRSTFGAVHNDCRTNEERADTPLRHTATVTVTLSEAPKEDA